MKLKSFFVLVGLFFTALLSLQVLANGTHSAQIDNSFNGVWTGKPIKLDKKSAERILNLSPTTSNVDSARIASEGLFHVGHALPSNNNKIKLNICVEDGVLSGTLKNGQLPGIASGANIESSTTNFKNQVSASFNDGEGESVPVQFTILPGSKRKLLGILPDSTAFILKQVKKSASCEITPDSITSSGGHSSSGGHGNSSGSHGHSVLNIPDGEPIPSIIVSVNKNPMSGYNLMADFTNFKITPENVDLDHIPGEGHAHIYIDGIKLARLYGDWFFLGSLEPGTHEVEVRISSNNHSELAVNDVLITGKTTVTVP